MSSASQGESSYLLNQLLRDVSRSFYLTLKFLPGSIRPQIGLAYLLARATDTIADTGLVPIQARLEALQGLRNAICNGAEVPEFKRLADQQALPAEKILLERVSAAVKILRGLSAEDQQRIEKVIDVITSGQELDLVRFDSGTATEPIALESEADLDDYTYRVAGCVGEFWTVMCLAHLKSRPAVGTEELVNKGVRFGKGLQLVNILRDIPADLRNGRCYLPASVLASAGLAPKDLLEAKNYPRVRPIFLKWLGRAREHLAAGWEYTNTLPFSWVRVRLACAWPILIGEATLQKLEIANVLEQSERVKVPKEEVKSIIGRSVAFYPFRGKWRRLGPGFEHS